MTLQVIVQAADPDRLIVGVGPFDPTYDPGPDGYAIYALDDSQLDAVMQSTAYLCADLKTVQARPC